MKERFVCCGPWAFALFMFNDTWRWDALMLWPHICWSWLRRRQLSKQSGISEKETACVNTWIYSTCIFQTTWRCTYLWIVWHFPHVALYPSNFAFVLYDHARDKTDHIAKVILCKHVLSEGLWYSHRLLEAPQIDPCLNSSICVCLANSNAYLYRPSPVSAHLFLIWCAMFPLVIWLDPKLWISVCILTRAIVRDRKLFDCLWLGFLPYSFSGGFMIIKNMQYSG